MAVRRRVQPAGMARFSGSGRQHETRDVNTDESVDDAAQKTAIRGAVSQLQRCAPPPPRAAFCRKLACLHR
ncbi:hypothetical protein P3T21_005681 [Paraburkholderia sp. GAS334]